MRFITLAATCLALAAPAIAQDTPEFTDDTGTAVTIPTDPQRVVSLHDSQLTVPLIELGVMPVGSHGRGETTQTAFIRASATVNGIDFGNSDVEWVGNNPAEIERIAALEPDLILTTQWQTADVNQLRAIAPTVVIDYAAHDAFEVYAMVADLAGATDRLDVLERRYADQIALIRRVIDTEAITVSTLQIAEDTFFALNPYGNIGKVLVNAGFRRPEGIVAIPEDGDVTVSAETIQSFDGDFLLTTYRSTAGDSPQDAMLYAEGLVPNFCDALHACREGQMFFLSRAEASAVSYTALGQTAYAILSIVGGRPYVPLPE